MVSEPPSPPERPNDYPPAALWPRLLARILDALAVAAPFVLLGPMRRPVAAALTVAALVLCADRLFGPGRSLGKRVAGLRVVVLHKRQPGGITASMRRNALFAIAVLPVAAGSFAALCWAAAAVAGVSALEAAVALSPLTRDLGRRRLGDLLAGTQVIDASIPLGLPSSTSMLRPRTAAAIGAVPRMPRAHLSPDSLSGHPSEDPACVSH